VLWSACYPLAACSGVVERRPRVRPAAIRARDLARVPCAAPSSAPSASWCSNLSRRLSGPRGCKRARTPGRHQVAAKQRARLGCARGSAPTGPAVKTSNPRLSPRDADRAVGGIRTWAQNSGRRASCPSTVLLSGALCELTFAGREDATTGIKPVWTAFRPAGWCLLGETLCFGLFSSARCSLVLPELASLGALSWPVAVAAYRRLLPQRLSGV
jgi:hypothetical protein